MLDRYTVLKSKISKTKGLLSTYLPGHDVKQAFDREDYVKALLLAANHTESQLRFFWKRAIDKAKSRKITPKDVIQCNKTPLQNVIKWCKTNKLITPKESKILQELREIRNDIAHNYQLNFNHNIDPKVCRRAIYAILPVIDSLHKRIIEEMKNP
jgi:uncharacterized protein YutE (UPF0331/DUF86 family)